MAEEFYVWGENNIVHVSRSVDEGHPDYPGHTYTPGDSDLPNDFPRLPDRSVSLENLEALRSWARNRWPEAKDRTDDHGS